MGFVLGVNLVQDWSGLYIRTMNCACFLIQYQLGVQNCNKLTKLADQDPGRPIKDVEVEGQEYGDS